MKPWTREFQLDVLENLGAVPQGSFDKGEEEKIEALMVIAGALFSDRGRTREQRKGGIPMSSPKQLRDAGVQGLPVRLLHRDPRGHPAPGPRPAERVGAPDGSGIPMTPRKSDIAPVRAGDALVCEVAMLPSREPTPYFGVRRAGSPNLEHLTGRVSKRDQKRLQRALCRAFGSAVRSGFSP